MQRRLWLRDGGAPCNPSMPLVFSLARVSTDMSSRGGFTMAMPKRGGMPSRGGHAAPGDGAARRPVHGGDSYFDDDDDGGDGAKPTPSVRSPRQ